MAKYKRKRDAEVYDSDYAVYERGYIKTSANNRGVEHDGYVVTVHGHVAVSSVDEVYADGEPYKYTTLELIWAGRMWRRQIGASFQPRTLVTLAKKFAAEVAAKAGE